MKIIEVNTKKGKERFIDSQWNFYKGNKNWVAPLKFDRKKLLNTKKNPFYQHSEIKLFLAERDGKVVGRIAGIINHNHNKTHNDKVGFFGFFECEYNQITSDKLFEAVEKWLKEKGFDTIRGPVNPSMNDENAVLVEGFDSPPVVLMAYNPEYYDSIIKSSGYFKATDTLAFLLEDKNYMTDKLDRFRKIIEKRFKIKVRSMNFKNKRQFKKDVTTLKTIYNNAWQPNWGFVKMTDEEFDFLVKDFKTIADPDFALIAESDGKPAGFALALPNINQSLIYNKSGNLINGAFQLLTKKKRINLVRVIVLGVLPEFQKKGVDSVLYHQIGKLCEQKGIKFVEASWILEDNDSMINGLTQNLNSKLYKRYRLYEKKI